MKFEFTLAWRFLREGRFQSALIIIGVAVGVAVVIYISALILGLQANTINRTLGAQAHIVIKPLDETVRNVLPPGTTLATIQPKAQRLRSVDNWQVLMPALAADPDVVAVSPMASGAAIAIRGEANRAIVLFGVELDRYDRIVELSTKLTRGSFRLNAGEVMIGTELAKDLGVDVGDRLRVLTTTANDQFQISGIVDLGSRDLNRRALYLPMRTAQNLLGIPGGATNIDIRVRDIFSADGVAKRLQSVGLVNAESWMQTNGQLLNALQAQGVSTTIIRVFVSIVVMLGIASVLVVSVVQKRKEIGILRAIGASRGQMTRVFLLQGALVGFVGSTLGGMLAALLVAAFSALVTNSAGQPLFQIEIEPSLLISSCLIATVCGTLAAVAPALRASKLDPAQAIRV
ncbi:MAG: ABC transporter permease [Betaproteobacteria bacterium]|nr:MAG: ABC transporter permease [Betaproteobacteria bacterium]